MPSLNPVATTVSSANLLLKASAGVLHSLSVTTSAAGFVLIHDSATVPADGTVTPIECYAAPIGTIAMNFEPNPVRFTHGCAVVFSTTGPFTQTSSATAFISGQVE